MRGLSGRSRRALTIGSIFFAQPVKSLKQQQQISRGNRGTTGINTEDMMKASLAVIAALFVSPAYASENAFENRYPAWLTDKATSWSDVQLTNSPCIPVEFQPVHGTGAPAQNQSLFTAPQLLSNVVPPSSSSGMQTATDASNSLALQLLSNLASPSSSSGTHTAVRPANSPCQSARVQLQATFRAVGAACRC